MEVLNREVALVLGPLRKCTVHVLVVLLMTSHHQAWLLPDCLVTGEIELLMCLLIMHLSCISR